MKGMTKEERSVRVLSWAKGQSNWRLTEGAGTKRTFQICSPSSPDKKDLASWMSFESGSERSSMVRFVVTPTGWAKGSRARSRGRGWGNEGGWCQHPPH